MLLNSGRRSARRSTQVLGAVSTHVHAFDGRWPFDDAVNTAVFCCEHVFYNERPILSVTHDHDGDWQFLCGDSHADELPKLLCLGCVVDKDASLWSLADLPIGWAADRFDLETGWVREAFSDTECEQPNDA